MYPDSTNKNKMNTKVSTSLYSGKQKHWVILKKKIVDEISQHLVYQVSELFERI